jgi:hypothetical protein
VNIDISAPGPRDGKLLLNAAADRVSPAHRSWLRWRAVAAHVEP